MIGRIAHALLLALTLVATACAPQPRVVAVATAIQDAQPAPPPRMRGKIAQVRPRLMDRTLASETLSPAVPVQPLTTELYTAAPGAALRSAGLVKLSRQHGAEGRPDAALAAARGGHALAVEAYGPDHVETLTALTVLGDALAAAGRVTEAETVLVIASSRSRRAFGAHHPATEAAVHRLSLHRALAPIGPLLRSFSRTGPA